MNKSFLGYVTKIIILGYLALLFNGEMYAHSWSAFIILPLVVMYTLYIVLLDALMKKFKFNALRIFITGSLIGLVLETFYSKSIFVNPILFGVNWLSVIIQFLYWGMAATIPFYLYKVLKNNNTKIWSDTLNLWIIAYLILELSLGTIIKYPNTILIWVITGLPLSIIVFIRAIKHKDFISSTQ